jgi:hypothetical protein
MTLLGHKLSLRRLTILLGQPAPFTRRHARPSREGPCERAMVRVAEGKRNFCDGRVSCGEQMPGAGEFHVVDGLKKLVFACAQFGSVEFNALLDKVLEQSDVVRIAEPSYSTRRVKAGGGEHNAL